MSKLINALRNRKKLVLSVAAYIAIYAFNRIVLNADDTQAHGTALAGAAIVLERVGPIFGVDVTGPKATTEGEVVVEVKPRNRSRPVERQVAYTKDVTKR